MSLNIALPTAGLLLFALSSALSLFSFKRLGKSKLYQRLALYSYCIGTLIATIGVLLFDAERSQLLIAAIAWVGILAIYIFKVKVIVSFLAPVVSGIILFQLLYFIPKVIPSATSVHVWLAICGQAFACCACALSLLYLWQHHVLKKKIIKWFGLETSALETLGKVLQTCLWLGFILLTISLATGFANMHIWNMHVWQQSLQLKIAWAMSVWVWYAAILVSRHLLNKPLRSIALMSLGGFLLLSLSFYGLLFFNNWHN